MSVRPLSPADMVALVRFDRYAGDAEITSHTWPRVEPELDGIPFLTLASMALAQRGQGRRAWMARSDGSPRGWAVARSRANGLAWDVEHLHVRDLDTGVAVELLEGVASHAGAHGARRVFLSAPASGGALEMLRRAGFERYTSETLYVLPAGFKPERTDLFEGRPRLRADEEALFGLYLSAVPQRVRAAEALTLEEWLGLHLGRRPWKPTIGGSRHQYAWELGASLVGWMEITFGQHSQFIQFLVHPRYDEASDKLLRFALLQVSPKAPVYVAAREYQPSLASALERAGFRLAQENELFVKMLAARVVQPSLVPANVVGG